MRTVFRHYRICKINNTFEYYQRGKDDSGRRLSAWEPSSRGGMTICFKLTDNGTLIYAGVALCSPRDNFSYRVGRRIAQGRAEAGAAMRWPSWADKQSRRCSEFIVSLMRLETPAPRAVGRN